MPSKLIELKPVSVRVELEPELDYLIRKLEIKSKLGDYSWALNFLILTLFLKNLSNEELENFIFNEVATYNAIPLRKRVDMDFVYERLEEEVDKLLDLIRRKEEEARKVWIKIRSRKSELIKLIRKLDKRHPRGVPLMKVVEEATKIGFTVDEAIHFITSLETAGIIFKPRKDHIKLVEKYEE